MARVKNRTDFAKKLAETRLSHVERAIAMLWYYRWSQDFEDRSASEMANDLHEEGFPKPNVSRLKSDLARSRFTVRSRRDGAFQLDVRRITELEEKFKDLLQNKKVEIQDTIIPSEWVVGKRPYLEKMVHQINGCYDYEFFDACATLCRRLMESLIIEIYISRGRQKEIKSQGVFFSLERLISFIKNDTNIHLGRNSSKSMDSVKQVGDTAAHDRVYITHAQDIDDIKIPYRRLIQDLLVAANLK